MGDRRDVNELGTFVIHDRALEPLHKVLRFEEKIVKPDSLGDRPVIKKDVNIKRRIVLEKITVRLLRVDASSGHILPSPAFKRPDSPGLMR